MRRLLFIIGILIFSYPSISDWWNSFHQSQIISRYEEKIESIDREETERIWKQAQEYNKRLTPGEFLSKLSEEERTEYETMLKLYADGMMGYVDIPTIECRLPIYHGTEEASLQSGAGHMESTSLPVGGMNTHCILSGHRGLPSARLFSGLDQLKPGDYFLIQILNHTLCYQVEQVQVVLPEQTESLVIEEGRDLCTLVTCTPYGINSHRLLVCGKRSAEPIKSEIIKKEKEGKEDVQMKIKKYMKWVVLSFLIVLFCAAPGKNVSAKEMEYNNNGWILSETEENKGKGKYDVVIRYPFEGVLFYLYEENRKEQKGEENNRIPIQIQTTNQKGEAVFEGIEFGQYFIVGQEHQDRMDLYRPVISEINLPSHDDWKNRQIVVYPKYEKEPLEEESTNEEKEPDTLLPQTGQHWTPVVLFGLLGVVLLIAAWLRAKI